MQFSLDKGGAGEETGIARECLLRLKRNDAMKKFYFFVALKDDGC